MNKQARAKRCCNLLALLKSDDLEMDKLEILGKGGQGIDI